MQNCHATTSAGESLLCFFSLLPGVHTTVSCPDGNEKLRKVCSQCSATVHVRRAVCGCGYAFPRKRRLRAGDVQAKKEERADRLYRANLRASETPQETVNWCKEVSVGRIMFVI